MLDVQYYIRKPHGSAIATAHLKELSAGLTNFITTTERGARTVAAVAAADYLIGDGRHGLRHYPPYKYIRRRQAYGKPFFSDKQRRFVMASLRAGRNLKTGTPMEPGYPHRTGNLQRRWQRRGNGTDVRIINTDPAVVPVMGDETQSRHERLVGWRMVSPVIESNLDGALKASAGAVEKYYQQKVRE